MIDANRSVFAKLAALVPANLVHHTIDLTARRWIATDKANKDCLKHAKVEAEIECLPSKRAAIVSVGKEWYVALPEGYSISTSFMRGVHRRDDIRAGLLTFLWSLDEFGPLVDTDIGVRLTQSLFGVAGEYNVESVASFFPPVQIWELDPLLFGLTPEIALYRAYGGLLLAEDGATPLPYPAAVRVRIVELLEQECGKLAGDVLFRAITASHWAHAFLDFYRCVEFLYQAPYVEELRAGLGVASHSAVGTHIERSLAWRPKEDQALERLLKSIADDAILGRLSGAFLPPLTLNAPTTEVHGALGAAIYRARNGIAHFRSRQTAPDLNWPLVIEHVCELLSDLYRRYGTIIQS